MSGFADTIAQKLAVLPVPTALDLPGGQRVGATNPRLRFSLSDNASLALLASGEIGALGQAIVEGRVRFEGSMRDLMTVAAAMLVGDPVHSIQPLAWWQRALLRAQSLSRHTVERDAEQIQFHYDVSDDFYALWLDPRRVYSCAYFKEPAMTLAQAQEAKLDHICRKLMLQPGERFLDIGCGWGGLLLWAAEHYGVDATGITLSNNQYAHVQKLIDERGLAGRVRVQLCDYRQLAVAEPFDKLASVGMFEHVGRAKMRAYFETVSRLVKPGAIIMNHGITSCGLDNPQVGAGMGDFIEKYIFPGGELIHVNEVLREMSAGGLEMVDTENLRPHYAKTLWAWSDELERQLEPARQVLVAQLGAARGDEVLLAYRLYLAGSAMAFEQGWISLHQVLAIRPDHNVQTGTMRGAQSAYPFNRAYIYGT